MSTETRATIENLYHLSDDCKAEIVNGELVVMSPTGKKPNRAGFRVTLPNRESFSPDAAFYTGQDTGMKFFDGAPVFAAEVRSEYDYGATAEREIQQKIADYFAAGTLVVWDVDLLGEDTVRVYRAEAPHTPAVYKRGEAAEAEPAVSGWTMAVDDLFQ